MSRIICFTDNGTVANTVEQVLEGHDLHILSASRLTEDVRSAVQRLAPDVILLELNRAMDNAHLYFFLRADQVTRSTPVILVSPTDSVAHQAAILEADGVLQRSSLAEQLWRMISQLLPLERSLAA